MLVQRQRAGHAAAETAEDHKIQRVQGRNLIPVHMGHAQRSELLHDLLRRQFLCQNGIILLAVSTGGNSGDVALVSRAGVRDVVYTHIHSPLSQQTVG